MVAAAVAQGARNQLIYKKQSALGTRATGTDFKLLRFNTHDLRPIRALNEGNEIRGDREVFDARLGNVHATGDLEVDLCYEDHDTLFESLMFGTFASDILPIGTTPQYLTIEDGQKDIAKYRAVWDLIVSGMQLRLGTGGNAMVRATFSTVARMIDDWAGSSLDSSPTAPSTNQPFDSFTGAVYDNLSETGQEIGYITAIDLNVENGVNPFFVVGQKEGINLEWGRGRVSGRLTMAFTDTVVPARFDNETEFPLVINLTDPDANTIEFRMPRCMLTTMGAPVSSERSRLLTADFVAKKDTVVGTALQITR